VGDRAHDRDPPRFPFGQHPRRARAGARDLCAEVQGVGRESRGERTRGTSDLARLRPPQGGPRAWRPLGTTSMSGFNAGVQATSAAWCGRTVGDFSATVVSAGSTSAPGVTGVSATALGTAVRRHGETALGSRAALPEDSTRATCALPAPSLLPKTQGFDTESDASGYPRGFGLCHRGDMLNHPPAPSTRGLCACPGCPGGFVPFRLDTSASRLRLLRPALRSLCAPRLSATQAARGRQP